jgi:acyl carrier protein
MNTVEILEQLRALSSTKAPSASLPEGEAFAAANVMETLGLDSLDIVRLILAVETQFYIELPDAALVHVKTFGDLAQAVKEAPSLDASESPA